MNELDLKQTNNLNLYQYQDGLGTRYAYDFRITGKQVLYIGSYDVPVTSGSLLLTCHESLLNKDLPVVFDVVNGPASGSEGEPVLNSVLEEIVEDLGNEFPNWRFKLPE